MEGDADAKWDVTGLFLMKTTFCKSIRTVANRLNLSATPAKSSAPLGFPSIN